MSGFLGARRNQPVINVLGGIRAQTSLFGLPIPILFGRNRIAGNLLWYGDFIAQPISGKGGGGKGGLFGAGGKGQANYDYGAAVAIALCQGPIQGIGGVWDTQGTLPVNDTAEDYTIGGGDTYTALQVATFLNDLGVTIEELYTVTSNDFGSPFGGVTLTGTQQVPMELVGGSPSAGQYTQSGGVYGFSAADTGKNVTIAYAYGPPNTVGSDPIASLNLTIFNGTQGQAPWSYLVSKHPSQALGYTLIAYAASQLIDLGSSAALPNLSFEVLGPLQYGNGNYDCNPRDVLYTLMTDPIIGAGFAVSEIGDTTQYSNYCVANGIFMSPVLDTQRLASDYFTDYLEATNTEIVLSGGLLKFVPYGDTTIVGNGATFQPQTNPIYDLDDDDFITGTDERPVTVERPSVKDAYNAKKVEFVDRGNSYNPQIVEAQDQGAIELYKYRPDGTKQYHFITELNVAKQIVQTQLSRAVNIRNKYKFKLGQRYILLDPMDIVTITDANLGLNQVPVRITSISEDSNQILSFEAEEFPWGCSGPTLYPKQPANSSNPNGSANPGSVNAPYFFEAVPRMRGGDPHMEIWIGISGGDPNYGGCRIWLSVDGGAAYSAVDVLQGSSTMGVCSKPVPPDFVAPWPIGSDPDTTNDLAVDLVSNAETLSSVATSVEDAFGSLCLVGNGSGVPPYELMSYAVATLDSPGRYVLQATGAGNYLRRGIFGTPITSHPIASPFVYVGSGVFKMPFDSNLVGTELFFKFTAFNLQNNSEQSLADVTAYSFTPTGLQPGLYNSGYSLNPAFPLSQDPVTLTNLIVAPLVIGGVGGSVSYLGKTFTGLSSTAKYYVTIFDPAFQGENAALGITKTYLCDTDPTVVHYGEPGYYYLGALQMVASSPPPPPPNPMPPDDGGGAGKTPPLQPD